MEIGTVGQWASACATFLAVLVALFKDGFTRLSRRPRLDLSALLKPPHCQIMQVHFSGQRVGPTLGQTNCCFLRLWVENKGKTRAEKVQVFAAKLLRSTVDGKYMEDSNFLPMNLIWSHGHVIGGNREIEVYADGISPRMGKHCDFGHVMDPNYRRDLEEDIPGLAATSTVLALALEVSPSTLSHLLAPGTYRLELRVAAANSSPKTKILEFGLSGNWSDDPVRMFSDGISMRILAWNETKTAKLSMKKCTKYLRAKWSRVRVLPGTLWKQLFRDKHKKQY
jgi:hypothetical protein